MIHFYDTLGSTLVVHTGSTLATVANERKKITSKKARADEKFHQPAGSSRQTPKRHSTIFMYLLAISDF